MSGALLLPWSVAPNAYVWPPFDTFCNVGVVRWSRGGAAVETGVAHTGHRRLARTGN